MNALTVLGVVYAAGVVGTFGFFAWVDRDLPEEEQTPPLGLLSLSALWPLAWLSMFIAWTEDDS